VQLGVPCSRCLTKPVQSFLQSQYLIFSANDEARRLPDVNFLHQIAIEEGGFHVHVMDPPSLVFCHCQNQANRFHSRDRSENFIEIDPLPLHVAFRDESGLVLDDKPVFVLLGLEDPLESPIGRCPGGSWQTSHVLFFSIDRSSSTMEVSQDRSCAASSSAADSLALTVCSSSSSTRSARPGTTAGPRTLSILRNCSGASSSCSASRSGSLLGGNTCSTGGGRDASGAGGASVRLPVGGTAPAPSSYCSWFSL
jgi:hypothetical protein